MKLFDNRIDKIEHYLSKHRSEGRASFTVLTTADEIIIQPDEGNHKQLRIKSKLWKA